LSVGAILVIALTAREGRDKNMKTTLFSSVAFAAVLWCLNALGGTRTYTFDDDSGWEAITGEYEVKGGEFLYEAPPTDGPLMGIVLLKEEEGVDTRDVEYIEVRGMDLNGPGAKNLAIFFGYDEDAPKAYFAGPFVGGMQQWIFADMTVPDNNWTSRGGSIVAAADDLGPNIWYKIRIEFKDDSATLYGAEEGDALKEWVTLEFPDGKPKGRIGIGGCDSVNKFDDFVVFGTNITPLAVEPSSVNTVTAWGAIRIGMPTCKPR
jgi:hypothetical protein